MPSTRPVYREPIAETSCTAVDLTFSGVPKNGKGKLGSELPDELRHKQGRLETIRQARKEMEAETAAAAARQRQEEAQRARAKATEAEEADAPAAEQAELRKKTEAAAVKANAAREKAIEAAEHAGLEPPDLEPLVADAMQAPVSAGRDHDGCGFLE